jgi:hypothetical protein
VLERVPIELNRERALESFFGRVFYSEPEVHPGSSPGQAFAGKRSIRQLPGNRKTFIGSSSKRFCFSLPTIASI